MDTSKFRTDHPNYRQYSDAAYVTTSVPQGLTGALSGVLLRLVQDQGASLTEIINRLRSYANDGPTGNWSWNYLVEDLQSALWALANDEKWLPRFMDGVLEAVILINRAGPQDVVEEVNELLHDNNFGYTVVRRPGGTYGWDLREDSMSSRPRWWNCSRKSRTSACRQELTSSSSGASSTLATNGRARMRYVTR
jgi:hypothetical protein